MQFLSKSLRQKVATIIHFYSMLGLVAGKSCNLWVSCNFRVLQLVGYRLYIKKKFSDKDHDDDDFIDFSIEEKKMSVVARKYVVHR